MKTTGQRIRAARLAAKLTQANAAALAGVFQPNWSAWENDHNRPNVPSLMRIGLAVGQPWYLLVNDE